MQEALVREIRALQQYKASHEDLSRKFEQIEHEVQLKEQRHTARLQLLQDKHDALAAACETLREEAEAARREASQRGQRNHRVYRKLQQAAQLLEAREREFEQNKALQEQRCADLQSQVALLQGQVHAKDERIGALLQDNAQLRMHLEVETVPLTQHQELHNAHQESVLEHKVLEESLQALERELAVTKASKSDLQLHFSRAEKRVAELQGEVVASNRKISQYVHKLQELQPELGESRSEVETAKTRIAELEKEKTTLQHHLGSTRVNLKATQEQRNNLQEALAASREQEDELVQQVQELTQQLDAAKSESQDLQSQQLNLQGSGAALQDELRALQRQHMLLQQRYDKLDQSFQKQAVTVDEINGENEMLTSRVCHLTKALNQKAKELQLHITVHEAEKKRSEALENTNTSLVQEKLVLENSMYRQFLKANGNGDGNGLHSPSFLSSVATTTRKNRYSMQTPALLRTQTSPIIAESSARPQMRDKELDDSEAADVLFSSRNNITVTTNHNSRHNTSLFTPPRGQSAADHDDASRFEEEISRLEGSLQTHLQDVTRRFN